MSAWHRGQGRFSPDSASFRSGRAPQCEQNFSPTNIIPKHDGHATVAKRAWQYPQCVSPVEAEAPQEGHFSVSAGMTVLPASLYVFFFRRENKGARRVPRE